MAVLPVDNPGTRTTLTQDETQDSDHHRSKKNVRALLESAARLAGAGSSFHFGPERQGQLTDARQSQLAELLQELEAPTPSDAPPDFTGGEHQVWISDPPTVVLKHTLTGFYGRVMDESSLLDSRTFQNRRRLILRGALPSEYLRRWAVLTDIFSLPTTYQGRTGNTASPQMVVAQPYIDQDDADPATIEDVTDFMKAYGFTKIDTASIAIPEVADVTWYRQRDGILITDAHARNFRKDTTGAILPIDLVVTTVPKGVSKILPEPKAEWGLSEGR